MPDTASSKATPMDRRIGRAIRNRRTGTGQKQIDVASAIGVTYQQLCKYETGTNRVSAATLIRLAEVLECQPGDILADATGASTAETTRPRLALQLSRAAAQLPEPVQEALLAMARALAPSTQGAAP
jgi:transcriptional regulator with XRE-family HTH domain